MTMLEGTITTPFGAVQKKTALIIGGGAVLIFGIVWYRGRNNKAAAAAANAGASTEINPATGYIYGSAEDAAAMAAQGAYQLPGGSGGGGGGGSSIPSGGLGTGFVSNGAWVQAVIEYMTTNGITSDPSILSAALGKYITGQPLSPGIEDVQRSQIEQAIAAKGYPPVAGPNGYPPSINTNAPVTPPPPTPPPPTPPPPPSAPAETVYTFRRPDTLASVAARYGMSQSQLYNFGTNAASLEQYAQWHGMPSSNGGNLIWYGYNIGVPA